MLLKQNLSICLISAFLVCATTVSAENPPVLVESPLPPLTRNPSTPLPEDQWSPNWPKFDEIIEGHHIVVPYYDPDFTDVPLERKNFDLAAFSKLENILNQLVDDLYVKRASIFYLSFYPFKIRNFIITTKAESAKLGGKHMKDNFVKDALVILKDISKYIEETDTAKPTKSKKEKQKEAIVMKQEFSKFLNLFRQVISASKVGKYLDWNKMTIDGKPVAQESARFYNYFADNGFKGAIWVMNTLVSLFDKFKG